MTEVWKEIPGLDGIYEASTNGRIRARARTVRKKHKAGGVAIQQYAERIIGSKPNAEGYCFVHISIDGKRQTHAVHRLVALTFHGHPKNGQECCHNNGNPTDNRPDNLRWDTHLANNRDRLLHGNYATGRDHHMAKFSAALIEGISAGLVDREAALAAGVSRTHYYRVRRLANERG